MRPYYEDDAVTIFHGDCLEIIGRLEADAVVTDPPYGTSYYATDTDAMTPQLLRNMRNKFRAVAVFGYAERLVRLCDGSAPDEWVTWWPSNAACRGVNYSGLRREAEHIAIFGDVRRLYDLRQPRASANSTALIRRNYVGANSRGTFKGELNSRRYGDVWTDAAPGLAFLSHLRQHPNEKSLAVMTRLVEGLTSPGDTVLDPFAGSGTTLRAAKNIGRKAVGVEIDEHYCEVAARRCAQEVLDLGGV